MKDSARYVLFIFAIIVVVLILLMWKRQDQADATKELKETYSADITVVDGEDFIIGCNSDLLTDLEAFAKVVKRVGKPTVLDLTGSPNLASFRGARLLPSLKSLIAIDCPKLTNADGISGLPELTELILTDSKNFSTSADVRKLPALESIDMSGCLPLTGLDVSELPALQNIYLSRCRNLKEIDLSSSHGLRQLFVDGCAALRKIKGLGQLRELTDLDVSNCDSLTDLDGLGSLKKLVVLDIRNMQLGDFRDVAALSSSLRVLRLGGQENLETLESFSSLNGLREIHLEACPNFRSLKGMPASVSQYAGFTYCPELKSLEGLSAAVNLEQLDVSGCQNLSDVAELEKMKNLVQLSLTRCRQVTDIHSVKNLKKLAIVLLGGSGVAPASIQDLKKSMKNTVFDFLLADQ